MASTLVVYAQEVIVPSVEELEMETGGLACEVEGCPGRFSGSSQLRMHMEKHHRKKPLNVKMGSSQYCCPVSSCERSKGGTGKPFPRLGQLKQHYQRIHGEKHSCKKCGKLFSLLDVYTRHIAECGEDITCQTCGAKFLTKNALFKHSRRKHQEVKKKKTTKDKHEAEVSTTETMNTPEAPVLLPMPPPVQIVLKQVVKLAKQVSVSTQTEDGEEVVTGVDVASGTCAPLFEQSPSSFLDFSTQTEAGEFAPWGSSSLHSSFDFNDLATQTDLSELLGFATRSAGSQTCLSPPNEELSRYLQSSVQSGEDSILKATSSVLNSLATSPHSLECVGTQTSLAKTQTSLAGTQTSLAGPGCYEGATQTSEDFFCPLDDDSRIDFGTQTMDWLSDVAALMPAPSCYGEETSHTIN